MVAPSEAIRIRLPDDIVSRESNEPEVVWAHDPPLVPAVKLEHHTWLLDGTHIIYERVPAYVAQPDSEDPDFLLLDPEVGDAMTKALEEIGISR